MHYPLKYFNRNKISKLQNRLHKINISSTTQIVFINDKKSFIAAPHM